MSQQVVIFNNEFSLSSYEFLTKVINPAREEAGENPVSNKDFINRVKDGKRKLTAVCSHQTRIGNLDAHLI